MILMQIGNGQQENFISAGCFGVYKKTFDLILKAQKRFGKRWHRNQMFTGIIWAQDKGECCQEGKCIRKRALGEFRQLGLENSRGSDRRCI